MLSAKIKINHIDYEKTFQQLFPIVKEKIGNMESGNLMIRLFQKLDDAALPVLSGVMYRLPKDTKNELLAIGMNTYSLKLEEKLNEELEKDEWGRHFLVGSLKVIRDSMDLFLEIDQVKVDYRSLLEMDLVSEKLGGHLGSFAGFAKGIAGLAATLAPDALERKGLELLWKENNKQKLIAIAKNTLDKHGFSMDLADIQLMQDRGNKENAIKGEAGLVLTEKLESEILDALSGYLKDMAETRSGSGEK